MVMVPVPQRYVKMRRTVTAAVRKAKNDWFQQKAKVKL